MRAFVDLFCGAGGWTTGLVAAGWKHLVGVDADAHACATYAKNHGASHTWCTDIAAINAADLSRFLPTRPECLLLVASPPCQSMSLIGPRRPGDAKDGLYTHVVRIAKDLRPDYVVLENVVGMKTKRHADGGTLLDSLLGMLKKEGYDVTWCILNAKDYGVPQNRQRMVLVAADTTRGRALPSWPPPLASPVRPLATVLDAFPHPADPFYYMSPAKTAYYERRHADATRNHYVRFLDPSKPAPTVRAGYMKSRGAEGLLRLPDGRIRMLTEKEVASIQTFPTTYEWSGPRGAIYRQIGNAVPPALANAIGLALANA